MEQANRGMEERRFNAAMDVTTQRVRDLSQAIQNMISRLEYEHERLDWKNVLADFSHINGQLALLGRVLTKEKLPSINCKIVLPFHLDQCEDANLLQLTDGRLSRFDHQYAPQYLRTKLESGAEEMVKEYREKEAELDNETITMQYAIARKQVAAIQYILNRSKGILDSDKEDKSDIKTPTSSDTYSLVASSVNGRNLKIPPAPIPPPQPIKTQAVFPQIPYAIQPGASSTFDARKKIIPLNAGTSVIIVNQNVINASINNVQNRPTPSIKTKIKSTINHPYKR